MDDSESPLQQFVAKMLDIAPNRRDFYDRKYQELTATKGKPLFDIQRGKSANPNRSTLRTLAKVIGQPIRLLERAADGEIVDPEPYEPHLIESDHPSTRSAYQDEVVDILQIDLSFSMGPGSTIQDYIEETPVKFDMGYIRGFTKSNPSMLRLAKGVGESMAPTIQSNDQVFIDTTQRVLNLQDRIWAISVFGAAAIKRLRTVGSGKILLVSDNPIVADQEVNIEDVIIAGRVLRFVRDI